LNDLEDENKSYTNIYQVNILLHSNAYFIHYYGKVHYHFQADDYSYAILTLSDDFGYPEIKGIFVYMTEEGSIHYDINNCGKDCHVLVKFASRYQDFIEPDEEEALAPRSEEDMDAEVCVSKYAG
jgi:hypothetical protein